MALLPLLLAAACGNATQPSGGTGAPPDGPPLPADVAIFDGPMVPTLLRQCSRSTPPAGEGTWQPTAADIAALEAALPAALAGTAHAAMLAQAPQGWRRQYGGIVRGGRRFIYGSFMPASMAIDRRQPERWRNEAELICDGGPTLFGVEYDVGARRFTHLAFNGQA